MFSNRTQILNSLHCRRFVVCFCSLSLSPSLSLPLSVSFSVFLFFILPFKLCKIIFNCHAYQRNEQSERTSSLSHASHRGLPLIVSNLAASVSHLTPVHFSRRASNCLYSYSNSNFESDIKVVASLRHPHPRLSWHRVGLSKYFRCILGVSYALFGFSHFPSLSLYPCAVLFLFLLRSMVCFVSKVQSASGISVCGSIPRRVRLFVCCYCRSLWCVQRSTLGCSYFVVFAADSYGGKWQPVAARTLWSGS